MENASQALLIAAGILIGLILITMIIYGYDQISNYYNTKEQVKVLEQLSDFNKQYDSYNRDDVRGSDILSLINKIIDYNNFDVFISGAESAWAEKAKLSFDTIVVSIDLYDSAKNFVRNLVANGKFSCWFWFAKRTVAKGVCFCAPAKTCSAKWVRSACAKRTLRRFETACSRKRIWLAFKFNTI